MKQQETIDISNLEQGKSGSHVHINVQTRYGSMWILTSPSQFRGLRFDDPHPPPSIRLSPPPSLRHCGVKTPSISVENRETAGHLD